MPWHKMGALVEEQYRDWCRNSMKDPEDVGSAVEYEEWFLHAAEEAYRDMPENSNY